MHFNILDVGSCHCVRLTRGSLPISKDSPVEAFQDRVDNRLCSDVINLLLGRVHVKNVVEDKLVFFKIVLNLVRQIEPVLESLVQDYYLIRIVLHT